MTEQKPRVARIRRVALLFIAVWIVLQVVVPAVRLTGEPPPNRFVWRMFSFTEPVPVYAVTTANGTYVADVDAVFARLRSDLPFDQFMPEHLCRVDPNAHAITWDSGMYECVNP